MNQLEEAGSHEDTYFTKVNETRQTMKAGTQAWNCYGHRSNKFLLVQYNFCFQNNYHDSVKFQTRLKFLNENREAGDLTSIFKSDLK